MGEKSGSGRLATDLLARVVFLENTTVAYNNREQKVNNEIMDVHPVRTLCTEFAFRTINSRRTIYYLEYIGYSMQAREAAWHKWATDLACALKLR